MIKRHYTVYRKPLPPKSNIHADGLSFPLLTADLTRHPHFGYIHPDGTKRTATNNHRIHVLSGEISRSCIVCEENKWSKFEALKNIISKAEKSEFIFSVDILEFRAACVVAGVFVKKTNNAVKIESRKSNLLSISSKSKELGKSDNLIAMDGKLRAYFSMNFKYIIDALDFLASGIDGGIAEVLCTNQRSPVVLRRKNRKAIIMPLRIQG